MAQAGLCRVAVGRVDWAWQVEAMAVTLAERSRIEDWREVRAGVLVSGRESGSMDDLMASRRVDRWPIPERAVHKRVMRQDTPTERSRTLASLGSRPESLLKSKVVRVSPRRFLKNKICGERVGAEGALESGAA